MISNNLTFRYKIVFIYIFAIWFSLGNTWGWGQVSTNLSSKSAPKTSSNSVPNTTKSDKQTNNNSKNTPNTSNPEKPTTESPSSSASSGKVGIKVYDPFLDNHLKAPPDGINVGKFGRKIKDVEQSLAFIGAKYQSYAFGRHSTMILSSYLITLSFDIDKRLGLVSITPKKPLLTVEPKAKDFFIKFFTEGADLSQISIVIEDDKLELKFINPNDY